MQIQWQAYGIREVWTVFKNIFRIELENVGDLHEHWSFSIVSAQPAYSLLGGSHCLVSENSNTNQTAKSRRWLEKTPRLELLRWETITWLACQPLHYADFQEHAWPKRNRTSRLEIEHWTVDQTSNLKQLPHVKHDEFKTIKKTKSHAQATAQRNSHILVPA